MGEAFIVKYNSDGSLNFSTYLGGSSTESARGVAVDNSGALYVTGTTFSPDFPTLNAYDTSLDGQYDIFVSKFNPDGTLNFSTYLGGSERDNAEGIGVDRFGSCYVLGTTYSDDFPTKNALYPFHRGSFDVIIAKFNPNGELNFSTYYGSNGWDTAKDTAPELSTAIEYPTSSPSPPRYVLNKTSPVGLYLVRKTSPLPL